MQSSSRGQMEGPSAYAPFTRCFVNCCCSVEFLTAAEARGPGSTTHVTNLLFRPYDGGTKTVRIWMPNFLFWRPTSACESFRDSALPSSYRRTFSRDYGT